MLVVTLLKTSTGGSWAVPLMAGLRERGHEVVVVLPDPGAGLGRRLGAAGVTTMLCPAPFQTGRPAHQLDGIRTLRGILRTLRPDVIHYQLFGSALAARAAAVGLPARKVHMVPGPLPLENPVLRTGERALCRLDDVIICSSQHLRDVYRRMGVRDERLPVVPYGVDCDRFRPAEEWERKAARIALDLPDDAFVAVCVAYVYAPKRLVYPGRGIKGHIDLIQAWARYRAHGGTGVLVMVGGGFGPGGERYRAQLVAASRDLVREGSLRWAESTSDVPTYYAAADLSVAPSLSENLGSAAESSAAGVPCLATTVGGLPELVDEQTGYTCPPEDPRALAEGLRRAERERRTDAAGARRRAARQRALRDLELGECVRRFCHVVEEAAG